MPTVLQLRRGTTAQNDAFTGAAGEISYNTTTAAMRIHDGSTAGGFEMLRNDGSNADSAMTVPITANNTTDETVYLTFVDGATGAQGLETDTGLTFNPSSNTLTTTTFSGTATTAQYADVAELYQADSGYEPGTVLIFGGLQEVTVSRAPDSNKVAGVVSTQPGILMNKDAQGEHMVPVALCGRVPTKVKGTINKGDMMVTSNIEGVAVASDNPQIGTVIGKALEDYDSEEVGTIEVVIGRL